MRPSEAAWLGLSSVDGRQSLFEMLPLAWVVGELDGALVSGFGFGRAAGAPKEVGTGRVPWLIVIELELFDDVEGGVGPFDLS